MTRIELPENDRVGRLVALPRGVAAALAATRLVEVRPEGVDLWRLTSPTNTVGAVRIGDLDVVVRPKAPFASLLFMLGYARDPGFAPDLFDAVAEDDLWPLVGETLARLAQGALLRGVLQGYVTRDDSLSVLRGRLRIGDQVARRPGMLVPVEVRFDEYDADIPENRILRSALHRLALAPRLPQSLRQRLTHLSARLDGAALLRPGSVLPGWRPTRLNERYQPALRLAEVVLQNTGLGTTAGGDPVASFVVNMATVFEDFLTTALREAFATISTGRTEGQYSAYLDTDRVVPIRPDIVHTKAGRPVAVLDAKYKLSDESGSYSTADLYQMHSYCTSLGLTSGHLAYAGADGEEAVARAHQIARTEITIVTHALAVSASPWALLSQVKALATSTLDVDPALRPRLRDSG